MDAMSSHSDGDALRNFGPIQYRATKLLVDYILLTLISMFRCLPNYGWAVANAAELALH